jgi:hypothetical protein
MVDPSFVTELVKFYQKLAGIKKKLSLLKLTLKRIICSEEIGDYFEIEELICTKNF